jgi:hypothetical protein
MAVQLVTGPASRQALASSKKTARNGIAVAGRKLRELVEEEVSERLK